MPKSLPDFDRLLEQLPEDYEDLAHEHRQLLTKHGNAKFRTAADLLRAFFVHAGADVPLRETSVILEQTIGLSVSPMRIHKKLLRAGPYLHALVERMASREGNLSPERWLGYDVLSLDATVITGPGATETTCRIHTLLRLSNLGIKDVDVTDATVGESLRNFSFAPGQLVLGDRGYSHASGIESVVEAGADVLLRLNARAMPQLRDRGGEVLRPADLIAWMSSVEGHAAQERHVEFTTKSGRVIEARVIGRRLRPLEVQRAHEQLRRNLKAHEVTQEKLDEASYTLLITTSRLTPAQCIELYRLRWQIELQFKRWKSLCGFDRLPNYLDETIIAWVYVKVLLGLMLERLATPASAEVFPPLDEEAA